MIKTIDVNKEPVKVCQLFTLAYICMTVPASGTYLFDCPCGCMAPCSANS